MSNINIDFSLRDPKNGDQIKFTKDVFSDKLREDKKLNHANVDIVLSNKNTLNPEEYELKEVQPKERYKEVLKYLQMNFPLYLADY